MTSSSSAPLCSVPPCTASSGDGIPSPSLSSSVRPVNALHAYASFIVSEDHSDDDKSPSPASPSPPPSPAFSPSESPLPSPSPSPRSSSPRSNYASSSSSSSDSGSSSSFPFCAKCKRSPQPSNIAAHLRAAHPRLRLSPADIRACSFGKHTLVECPDCGTYWGSNTINKHRQKKAGSTVRTCTSLPLRPEPQLYGEEKREGKDGSIPCLPSDLVVPNLVRGDQQEYLPSCYPIIPPRCVAEWTSVVRSILQRYAIARSRAAGDLSACLPALKDLLELPFRALSKTRGGGRNRLARSLNSRLRIVQTELDKGEPWLVRERDLFSVRVDADQSVRRIKRCNDFLARGELGRAARALTQQPLVDVSPDDVTRLKALHPPASAPLPAPPPGVRVPIAFDARDVADIISRKVANGSAPATFGWTGEHLLPLLQDSSCLSNLTVLLEDIANGSLSSEARDLLTTCRLVGVPKPHGSGLRPLGLGETFLKCAAALVLRMVPDLALLFAPLQFAVGEKGGPERALHCIRACLDRMGSDAIAISTDFQNAFNCRRRASIARALYARPSTAPLWPLFEWVYGKPSMLKLYSKSRLIASIPSAEGVRQGDELGSFLYCISTQDLMVEANKGVADAQQFAVADDDTIVGKFTQAFIVFDKLRSAAEADGLLLVLPKCRAFWRHTSEPPRQLVDLCNDRGIQLVTRAMPLLGSLLSDDAESTASFMQAEIEKHREFFSLLLHRRMPVQAALSILRVCGLPRFTYLVRTLPSEMLVTQLAELDRLILDTAVAKLALPHPLPNAAEIQIRMPVRLGGFGLRPFSQVAPIAFFSSVAQIARDCPDLAEASPLATSLRASLAKLEKMGLRHSVIAARFTDTWSSFHAGAPPRLQHVLTERFEQSAHRHYVDSGSDEHKARLKSATAAGAALWRVVLPTSDSLTMDDFSFRLATRALLGLPAAETLPANCACMKAHALEDPHHFHACVKLRRTAVTNRHDALVQAVARIVREAGVVALVERAVYDELGKRLRPDAQLCFTDGTELVDVSCICPCASSHVSEASAKQGAAAVKRGKEKSTKYDALAEGEGKVFVPLVLETPGALGLGLEQLIDRLAVLHSAAFPSSARPSSVDEAERRFIFFAKATLSVTLQRGNAHVLVNGCINSRLAGAVAGIRVGTRYRRIGKNFVNDNDG